MVLFAGLIFINHFMVLFTGLIFINHFMVLFFYTAGTRLLRGYRYEAVMDDKPPDITHLLFVVHGIGQKMETGSIIKSCRE